MVRKELRPYLLDTRDLCWQDKMIIFSSLFLTQNFSEYSAGVTERMKSGRQVKISNQIWEAYKTWL